MNDATLRYIYAFKPSPCVPRVFLHETRKGTAASLAEVPETGRETERRDGLVKVENSAEA